MAIYAGLDVSDKLTHICVVDKGGAVGWRGACATDPEVLAQTLARHCPGLVRVVLETGALSAFLYPFTAIWLGELMTGAACGVLGWTARELVPGCCTRLLPLPNAAALNGGTIARGGSPRKEGSTGGMG